MKLKKGELFKTNSPLPQPPPPPPPTLGSAATAGGTSTINSQIGSPFGKMMSFGKMKELGKIQSMGHALKGELFKGETFTHEEMDMHFDRSGGRDQHFTEGMNDAIGKDPKQGYSKKGLPHGEYVKKKVPLSLVPRAHEEAPIEDMAQEYAEQKTKAPPIILRPHPHQPGMYQVMDGQHRARAAHLRGDSHIEAFVHQPKGK